MCRASSPRIGRSRRNSSGEGNPIGEKGVVKALGPCVPFPKALFLEVRGGGM